MFDITLDTKSKNPKRLQHFFWAFVEGMLRWLKVLCLRWLWNLGSLTPCVCIIRSLSLVYIYIYIHTNTYQYSTIPIHTNTYQYIVPASSKRPFWMFYSSPSSEVVGALWPPFGWSKGHFESLSLHIIHMFYINLYIIQYSYAQSLVWWWLRLSWSPLF